MVGRVVRPHGIHGEVVVQPSTDQPERRFVPGAVVTTDDGTVLTVATVRPHAGRLLVRLAGVGDRDAAEHLRRARLSVDVTDDDPLDVDTYYDAQLVGLAVRASDGSALGTVADVEHGPAQDLLVLDLPTGAQARVPFVAALVPRVEVDEGWLLVDAPPGLLEQG